MEEPELTLTSTSDISIAEMDFANLTLEEKREDEAKSCFQVNFTALINPWDSPGRNWNGLPFPSPKGSSQPKN